MKEEQDELNKNALDKSIAAIKEGTNNPYTKQIIAAIEKFEEKGQQATEPIFEETLGELGQITYNDYTYTKRQ